MKEILNKYDNKASKGFYLYEVAKALSEKFEKFEEGTDELIEYVSLQFAENYSKDSIESWGTYFGPMHFQSFGDGTYREFPSIKILNESFLAYWLKRKDETTNPILKSRYLGLIYDFSSTISNKKPDYKIAKEYIDSLIEFSTQDYSTDRGQILNAFHRALEVATAFGQKDNAIEIFGHLMQFQNDNPEWYGVEFDSIIKHKFCDEETEEAIVERLSKTFEVLKDKAIEENYPWNIERVGCRLARFYRSKNNHESIEKILTEIKEVFFTTSAKASGLQGSGWLEHLNKLYVDFNLGHKTDDIVTTLREKQKEIELSTVTTEGEISSEEIDKFLSEILDTESKQTIYNIAQSFIPNKQSVLDGIYEYVHDPIMKIFSIKNIDDEGRTLSNLGSIEEDEEGNVIKALMENMPISHSYLNLALYNAFQKKLISTDEIIKILAHSPIIDDDRIKILSKGLDAYFDSDHIQAIHLIIPQIEDAIRNILEQQGGAVLKRTRSGSYHLKTFDEILRDQKVLDVLGDDCCLYLRMVFTDQRGLNLRNDMCHGNMKSVVFNQAISNRVVQCLMVLCLVQEKPADNTAL